MVNFVLIFMLISFRLATAADFPSEIPRCEYGSHKCLKETMTKIIHQYYKGYNRLHLASIDPLRVKSFAIQQDPGRQVDISIKFNNISFTGIKKAEVYKVLGYGIDPTKGPFEVHAKLPSFKLLGKYEISGKVLVLPINGKGYSNITFDNVDVLLRFTPTIDKTKDASEGLWITIPELYFDFKTTRMHVNFENLFEGNKLIGDTTNQFLNENWKDVFDDLKPEVCKAMAEVFRQTLNLVYAYVPYDQQFLH